MERRYFRVGKKLHKIWLTQTEAGRIKYRIDEGEERQAACVQLDEHILLLETPEGRLPVYIVRHSQEVLAQIQGESFQLREEDAEHGLADGADAEDDKVLAAPVPAKVVKILVAPGDAVKRGQSVIILDSMKVELELKASAAGKVREVLAQEGQQIPMGQPLMTFE